MAGPQLFKQIKNLGQPSFFLSDSVYLNFKDKNKNYYITEKWQSGLLFYLTSGTIKKGKTYN